MTTGRSLAEELAARTGLAQIIASGVIRRACARVGTTPDALTLATLERVIDAMEPLLAVYLKPEEAAHRAAELRRFAR